MYPLSPKLQADCNAHPARARPAVHVNFSRERIHESLCAHVFGTSDLNWARITCSAVLSPVHLSVCGKSQEHSTPAFVIFGHSQTVSGEGEGAWDVSLTFPSSGLFTGFDEFTGTTSVSVHDRHRRERRRGAVTLGVVPSSNSVLLRLRPCTTPALAAGSASIEASTASWKRDHLWRHQRRIFSLIVRIKVYILSTTTCYN